MERLTTYNDGEARVLGIGHKIAFARLAAYEDTGLLPREIPALRARLEAAEKVVVLIKQYHVCIPGLGDALAAYKEVSNDG